MWIKCSFTILMIHYVAVDKKHCPTPFPYQSIAKSTNDCLVCTKKNYRNEHQSRTWPFSTVESPSKPLKPHVFGIFFCGRHVGFQNEQIPWARLGLAPKVEKRHLSAAVWASSTSKNNRLLYLMLIVYFPIFRGGYTFV